MRAATLSLTLLSFGCLLPAQTPGADGAVDEAAVQFFLEEGLETRVDSSRTIEFFPAVAGG